MIKPLQTSLEMPSVEKVRLFLQDLGHLFNKRLLHCKRKHQFYCIK